MINITSDAPRKVEKEVSQSEIDANQQKQADNLLDTFDIGNNGPLKFVGNEIYIKEVNTPDITITFEPDHVSWIVFGVKSSSPDFPTALTEIRESFANSVKAALGGGVS